MEELLHAIALEHSAILQRSEEERLELKKALDRIECHARSLGPGGKDLPPEYRAEALPDADPFPPAAVPEDLDDDDLVLPTDNLNWGQTRLVSNETEMSIVSTMARAAEKTKSSSPGEGSKQHVTSTSSIVEPAMALIVQQSMEVDLYQLRRRRIKDITDYVGCTLVFINYVVLLVELEVEGRQTAILLGLDDGDLALQPDTLRVVDCGFVLLFLIESLFRLGLEGRDFFKDWANVFDLFLVVLGLVDFAVSPPFSGDGASDIVLLKVMRALKSLRALRIVRSFRFLSGLRVLVKACQCFLPSLFWAMVLLSIFIFMGAMIMANALHAFIIDPAQSYDDRVQMWTLYGTAYRSAYTIYEVTFAGNWPTNARPVLNKVSQFYSIFFVVYVTIIVFALIRIISAIFLKDTLDAAQNDAEHLVVEKMHKKADYVRKLEHLFQAIDASGSGLITEERLTQILGNPKVAALFQTLDLDVHESEALFHLLDDGDGEVTLAEFIDGVMRCKGPARAIDQVAMHAEMKQLSRRFGKLLKQLKQQAAIPKKQTTLSAFLFDSADAASLSVNLKNHKPPGHTIV